MTSPMQFVFLRAAQSPEPGLIEIHGRFGGAPCCLTLPAVKALEMAGALEAAVQPLMEKLGGDESRSSAVG